MVCSTQPPNIALPLKSFPRVFFSSSIILPAFSEFFPTFQHARTKHKSWFFLEPPLGMGQMFCSKFATGNSEKKTDWFLPETSEKLLFMEEFRVKPSHPWWCHGLVFTQCETFGWASKTCIFVGWLPVEFQWIPAETPPPPTWYSEETHPRGW